LFCYTFVSADSKELIQGLTGNEPQLRDGTEERINAESAPEMPRSGRRTGMGACEFKEERFTPEVTENTEGRGKRRASEM
jgi:hypothetical protein